MCTRGGRIASAITAPPIFWAILLGADSAGAGERAPVDGVPHVRNSAEPAEGRQIKQLEERWRVGGSHDDVIFGMITQVVADAEGTVGVLMEFPGRLVRVDRANAPAPTVEVFKPGSGAFVALDGCFAGGPTLLLSGNIIAQAAEGIEARTNFLSIYSLAGEEQVRLASYDYERNFNRFVFSERVELPSFFWANCVDGDGRIYTAPFRDRYLVEVYSPTGKLERVIERDYEPLQRTEESFRRFHDQLDAVLAFSPFPYKREIEREEYDILASGGHRSR